MYTAAQIVMALGLVLFAGAWLFVAPTRILLLLCSGGVLLLGILLRLSAQAPGRRRCPDCAEAIQPSARRCKHCGASLQPESTP